MKCYLNLFEWLCEDLVDILVTQILSTGIGWRAQVHPKTHPVSEYEFDVIIGGDGRRNTLEGNYPILFAFSPGRCLFKEKQLQDVRSVAQW